MGSNKRYADSIDRRMDQKIQHLAERPPEHAAIVREWRPPWPPVRFGEDEWFLMRDSNREPAAIVRKLRLGPRNETFYRVVRWALLSADRTLVGYFATLEEADRSVLFVPDGPQEPGARRGPNGV